MSAADLPLGAAHIPVGGAVPSASGGVPPPHGATSPLAPSTGPERSLAGRRAWQIVAVIVAVIAVGWGVFSILAGVAHQPFHRLRTFSGPVTTVRIDANNGPVTVLPGAPTGAVVDAKGSRSLVSPSDGESLVGGVLTLHSSCGLPINNFWCGMGYSVHVPPGAAVVIDTSNGAVHVSGIGGPLTLHTDNGSVHVSGSPPTVSAQTSNASVHLALSAAPSHVAVHSSNGSVTVTLPRTGDVYRVTTHTSEGHNTDGLRTDPTSTRSIQASTSNGNITLGYAPSG